jgi:polysaccharide biosynthesis protein PslG
MSSPSSRFLPLFAALLTVALAAACTGSSDPGVGARTRPHPKPSPTPTAVPGGLGSEFFGLHDSQPVGDSWPPVPVGSLRVWDAGVAWNQVEKTPGTYDWSRLDEIVKTARDHHTQLLIVLGQTPAFHSRHPKKVGAYGPGAASMPDLAAWTAYVKAIVTRYHAPDVAFQVWNEANVEGYWNGTYRQMAKLTAAARTVVNTVTPRPLLVAPAMATRTLGQRAGLRLLYAERVNGVRLGGLVDVVSLQLYPEIGAGPARSDTWLKEARRILRLQGVPADKPIWDTEINYGLQGGQAVPLLPPEQQAANVAMTYVLDAAGGLGRVFWYSWDLHGIANTDLVSADGSALSAGGQAFQTVRRWLLGTKPSACTTTADGTWVCPMQSPEGQRTVFWNPDREASVSTGFGATSYEVLGQTAASVPLGGTTLQVGDSPVLVTAATSGVAGFPPRA